MMEDIAEQHEVAREISDGISNPIAFAQNIDENENKLSTLEGEKLTNTSNSTGEAANEGEDVSNSATDSVKLLPYLDEVSWKFVGEKLQTMSPEEAETFANSSSFFRNLLAPQRTNFLFEKVLPLVINTVWKNEGLEGMPLSDVRKCRGVCKHWNAVFGKLKKEQFGVWLPRRVRGVDDPPFQSLFWDETFHCFSNLNEGQIRSRKTIQQFPQYVEVFHPGNQSEESNPVVSEFLMLNIYGDHPDDLLELLRWYRGDAVIEDCHRFLEDISLMVSRYGHHIHSATVDTRTNQLYDNPLLLPEWLRHMPNLSKFELQAIGVDSAELNLEEDQDFNPFPTLRHLDVVKMYGLPISLFRQFIRQNNHVSELWTDMFSHLDIESYNVLLPNLKKISLNNGPEIIEKLASPQVQWHLETLGPSLPARLDYAALFTVIENKFASTLKSLILTFVQDEGEESTLWQDLINCRLHLPELIEIHLNLDEEPACLDFLLPMKNNLEEIKVVFGYEFLFKPTLTFTDGPIVQFMGFQENMLKSNVWLLFKKLRKFEVQWQNEFDEPETRLYSREDWLENNEYI